jgi:hypothetical protein
MEVRCPSCDEQIKAEDMNLENLVARCRSCNALINLRRYLRAEVVSARKSVLSPPPHLAVEETVDGLLIRLRWYRHWAWFLAAGCISWDSFLIFSYTLVAAGDAPWGFWVFPAAFVAVGVAGTYFTLAMLINRTLITVREDRLAVSHGPLPWPGNKEVRAAEISQIYVAASSSGESYAVMFQTKDGHSGDLVTTSAVDEALYLEQQIEKYLRIVDRPVHG